MKFREDVGRPLTWREEDENLRELEERTVMGGTGNLLTGLTLAFNTIVNAGHTVLQAIGFLQKQALDVAAALTAHVNNLLNPHNVTKAQVGLGAVANLAPADLPISDATQAALDLKAALSLIGALNGIAPLDSSGLVPAIFLPGFVDDVLEFANLAAFPLVGETGKIYIALDTSEAYRWTGTVYWEIVASPGTTDAIVEGIVNLFFTVARVRATTLVGLAAGVNTPILATDTILSAFANLQAEINAVLAAPAPVVDLIEGQVFS